MDKMTIGAILFIIGIALLLESLFADPIGIGNRTIFGVYQMTGTVVGAILTSGGLFLLIKHR